MEKQDKKQAAPTSAVVKAAGGLSDQDRDRLKAMFGNDQDFKNLKLVERLLIPTIDGDSPIGAMGDMRLIIDPRDTDEAVANQARMVVGIMLTVQGTLGVIKQLVSEKAETETERIKREIADSTR